MRAWRLVLFFWPPVVAFEIPWAVDDVDWKEVRRRLSAEADNSTIANSTGADDFDIVEFAYNFSLLIGLDCGSRDIVDAVERRNPLVKGDLPPIDKLRSNPVDISFTLVDLDEFSEGKEILTVKALVHMVWSDCRWAQTAIIVAWYCSVVTPAPDICATWSDWEFVLGALIGTQFGPTGTVEQSRLSVRNQLEAINAELFAATPSQFWTPVPDELALAIDVNPRSKTNGDSYVCPSKQCGQTDDNVLNQSDIGMNFTRWNFYHDYVHKINFKVDLEYTSFPFDHQTLNLCFDLDQWSDPIIIHYDEEMLRSLMEHIDYAASSIGPHVTQKAVDSFKKKGWNVGDAKVVPRRRGFFYSVCMELEVDRKPDLTVVRVFLPATLLMTIPFVGFWMPPSLAMPRVATGFLSFLGFQVFRASAYSLVPSQSTSFIWIDVMILVANELMWLTVVANLAAQIMLRYSSRHAASLVDNVSRTVFPIVSFILLLFLFVSGSARVRPEYILLVTQIILVLCIVACVGRMYIVKLRLPGTLMRKVVTDMTSRNLLFWDAEELDNLELVQVFLLIDSEKRGWVTPIQILDAMEGYGLHADREDHRQAVRRLALDAFSDSGLGPDSKCSVDVFKATFKKITSAQFVREVYFLAAAEDVHQSHPLGECRSASERKATVGSVGGPDHPDQQELNEDIQDGTVEDVKQV